MVSALFFFFFSDSLAGILCMCVCVHVCVCVCVCVRERERERENFTDSTQNVTQICTRTFDWREHGIPYLTRILKEELKSQIRHRNERQMYIYFMREIQPFRREFGTLSMCLHCIFAKAFPHGNNLTYLCESTFIFLNFLVEIMTDLWKIILVVVANYQHFLEGSS